MNIRHRIGRSTAALAFTLLLSSPTEASGPAFTRLFAVADNAVTAGLNPAGMTRLDSSQFSVQAILASGYGEFKVDDDLTTTTGGNPRDSDPVLVPSLYYVRPITEDWRLGLSIMVPAGFGAENGPSWAGRYYSDQFDLVFVATNVTVAYPVTDWLSLGGGISIMGSSSSSTTQVNNIGPNNPDAKLKMDAEGVGYGAILSALVELSDKTRFSVTWYSETEPDDNVKVELNRSTLPPALVDAINTQGDNIEATLRVPQHVSLGAYHEFDNGWSATLDAIWVEYSRFGLTELSVDGVNLNEADMGFNDFWVLTAGFGFPLTPRMEGRVGVMYMEQPISNADRTFSFDMDTVYGGGVGIHYKMQNDHSYDLNLSVFNTGHSPIDTGAASEFSLKGRVAGETDTPYGVVLEFSYFWR